jgi:hypothetical protein
VPLTCCNATDVGPLLEATTQRQPLISAPLHRSGTSFSLTIADQATLCWSEWFLKQRVLRQAMGLAQVRHWARLLPLLLAWAAGPNAAPRARALRALHAALRAGWPRLPPHARLIWRHLAAAGAPRGPARGAEGAHEPHGGDGATLAAPQPAHAADPGQGQGSAAEEDRWAAAVAEVLWWAGGDAFREEVLGGGGAAGGLGGCRLRAHVLTLAPDPAAGMV